MRIGSANKLKETGAFYFFCWSVQLGPSFDHVHCLGLLNVYFQLSSSNIDITCGSLDAGVSIELTGLSGGDVDLTWDPRSPSDTQHSHHVYQTPPNIQFPHCRYTTH